MQADNKGIQTGLYLPPMQLPYLYSQAIDFEHYLQLTREILALPENERSGLYSNDKVFRYTSSNLDRMQSVLKFMTIEQKLYNLLSDLNEEWVWLVISEPWCGDASWGTAGLFLISRCTDKIDFKIILRDSHADIMNEYQTNETDSIPKLICFNKVTGLEIGRWGPRPAALQMEVNEMRDKAEISFKEGVRKLHSWYLEDNSHSMQEELTLLIKDWKQ